MYAIFRANLYRATDGVAVGQDNSDRAEYIKDGTYLFRTRGRSQFVEERDRELGKDLSRRYDLSRQSPPDEVLSDAPLSPVGGVEAIDEHVRV